MYLACLGLWIAALMALLPDMMGVKEISSISIVGKGKAG